MGSEGAMFGPYRVLRRLGSGAAGEVYLVDARSAGPQNSNPSAQQLALKILSGPANDTAVREMARQAHLAGQLQQPHIIPLHDIVEHNGRLGIAMAFAPGGSLGDQLGRVTENGTRKLPLPLSAGIVARLVTQLARALASAHDAQLAHGDLKPNNIFVRTAPSGHPLAALADFGQGVVTGAAATLVAQNGAARRVDGDQWPASQLRFAAPEQLHGETLPASDQYALAAIAYHLLTGAPPIQGDGVGLLSAIQQQEPIAPSLRSTEVPTEVDAIFRRALAKDPAARFASVSHFAQTLDEALAVALPSADTSMTQQLARLAGSTPGMPAPSSSRLASQRPADAPSQSDGVGDGSDAASRERWGLADASPTINRRLAAIAGVALLISIVACAFTFRAFQGASILPHFQLGSHVLSANPGATATANVAATATARQQETRFKSATAGTPLFKDALLKNDNHWATDGKTIFFASDGLHIQKVGPSPAIGTDAPAQTVPLGKYSRIATSVDITFNVGGAGDLAGLRFFVSPTDDGSQDYYAFLISTEGRYELWVHHNRAWSFLRGGYSVALKPGHAQTNTLAVLADGTKHEAELYANGQYLETVTLTDKSIIAGNVGLVVIDGGVDARFTNLAVWDAGA